MSLTSNIKLQIDCEHRKTLDMAEIVGDLLKTLVLDLATGTGANKADQLFHDVRTLGDGSNEDLDLYGVLADAFGDTLNMGKIKFLLFYNTSTTQTLTLKPAAANGFLGPFGAAAHTITVKPATAGNLSWVVLIADPNGYQVTTATNDLFNVANEAGAATDYGVLIIASST